MGVQQRRPFIHILISPQVLSNGHFVSMSQCVTHRRGSLSRLV